MAIPHKRKLFQKRGRKRFHKKGKFYKQAVKPKGQVMINRTKVNQHIAMAPHYYTKLSSGIIGRYAAGAAQLLSFQLGGNNLHLPWTTGVTSNFTGGGGVLIGGTALNALYPQNYHSLIADANGSAIYSGYRVYGSKVQLSITPTAGADLANIVIFPCIAADLGNFGTLEQAMVAPYNKCIQVSGNNMLKDNTIIHYMDTTTLYGYTKQQLQDDPSFIGDPLSTVAYVPNDVWFWNVLIQTVSGAVTSAIVGVEVRVEWYAECIRPKMNANIT